ncbi:MAG: MmcQ/YjbR family DNA-binding protein [Paludibacteraceae bacterium]
MNVEDLRKYCLSLRGAEETFPFDNVTLVMKVGGKIFAIIPLDVAETSISLKCHPNLAVELRERYNCVKPGYHLNKVHWNTVFVTSEITTLQVKGWIDASYNLIKSSLPQKIRRALE